MDSERRRNAETDLKATAEDLAHDARRVEHIERLKAELPPDHPQLADLAEESEHLTEAMAMKARMEAELVEQAGREPSN
jgi:hypothetical protein